MKTKTTTLCRKIIALLGITGAVVSQATSIPLANPGFESPVVGAWSSGFAPAGWSIDYGSFMQGPTSHGGGSQCLVNLGQHGWFNLSQQTTNTVQMAGETLTAQAYAKVSNLEKGTCNFRLILYLGGNPVATNTLVVTTNMVSGQSLDWTVFKVQYIASAGDVGKTIGIAVGSDGGNSPDGYSPSYCCLDDVSLDALLGVGITVGLNNPAFESPTVGAWSSGFFPDGWSIDYGSFVQGPTSHGGGNQCVVNLGLHGWFNLSQQTTNMVQMAGEVLTAQAYARVSNLEKGTCDFRLILYIGGNPVATNTFVVTTSMVSGQSLDWTPFTVQYVASAADVGQTIGIGVGSDGGESPEGYSPSYCYLDDVTLSALLIGAPTVSLVTSSPNPVDLYSNTVMTAVIVPGAGALASVIADASPLGGSNALVLVYSNTVDGARVYTNTVAASAPVDYDVPLTVRVLATDANGLTGEGNTKITVNRPSIVTWGGGTGNWGDANWLPYNVTGPITGANRTAIVTNGEVTVDHSGGVGGVAQIVLAQSGTLLVANGHYGGYGNILFTGGTLDTADDSSYHSYGASILTAVTASGSSSSKIADTAAGTGGGAGWFNLAYPSTAFTVSNGATLTVSAMLAGANNPANDNLYIPSALVKAGGGTLVLSGKNTYEGGTTVSAGTLSLESVDALAANTALRIVSEAKVNLKYSGTIPLSTLVLNGVTQAGGTYGASGSGATHINDAYFTGTGVLSVPAPLTLVYAVLPDGQLQFSWDGTATLQVQTNSLSIGLGSNWVDYSSTSPVTIAIDRVNGSVFFRLKQ